MYARLTASIRLENTSATHTFAIMPRHHVIMPTHVEIMPTHVEIMPTHVEIMPTYFVIIPRQAGEMPLAGRDTLVSGPVP